MSVLSLQLSNFTEWPWELMLCRKGESSLIHFLHNHVVQVLELRAPLQECDTLPSQASDPTQDWTQFLMRRGADAAETEGEKEEPGLIHLWSPFELLHLGRKTTYTLHFPLSFLAVAASSL